jgi:DNA-directed RNA polymerase specialized sigma24 family protein
VTDVDPPPVEAAPSVEAAPTVEAALVRLAREAGPRVLAVLARRFGDLDLAEDAVQEGLVEAAGGWPTAGVPDNPAAWLMTVARRKALDALRRNRSQDRRMLQAGFEAARLGEEPMVGGGGDGDGGPTWVPDDRVADERLRLMLLCCHPALDRDCSTRRAHPPAATPPATWCCWPSRTARRGTWPGSTQPTTCSPTPWGGCSPARTSCRRSSPPTTPTPVRRQRPTGRPSPRPTRSWWP